MLKRIAGWLVLVPLSVLLIVFALANRQAIVVNFNPLVAPDLTAPGVGVPLFLVVFACLLVGVVLGGAATWLGQGRVRRDRRRWQREAERLARDLNRGPTRNARNRPTAEAEDADDLLGLT
jgi:uncharacterized integral membrane protein